jgi:hypothetical protein
MEDIADRIADELEPPAGWGDQGNRREIVDAALTMLDTMDEDTVEETLRGVFRAVSSEYGA